MKPTFIFERKRPKIVIPDGMLVIQDTREQKKLFEPAPYIVNKGLRTGDYSIAGMEDLMTIERKSIPDLYGTLGGGRKRFSKQLERMFKMAWSGLLVEGTEDQVMIEPDRGRMTPNQIYHALSSLQVDGVHIYYAKDKESAREWVLSRLSRFYLHYRMGKTPESKGGKNAS